MTAKLKLLMGEAWALLQSILIDPVCWTTFQSLMKISITWNWSWI